MEIINSKSPEFKSARKWGNMQIHFGENTIALSASAARKYGIKSGQYLHFVVDTDYLYFFINEDSAGMKLFAESKNEGVHGYGKTRVKILTKKLPRYKLKGTFPIKEAATHLNEHKLYVIMLHLKYKHQHD